MKHRLILNTAFTVNRFHPRYQQAQKFLDSEVLRDCGPYVPFRTGNLWRSGNTGTVIGSGKVEYNAPYARPMYYARNAHFSKEKHPQAQAQWLEPAKATKGDAWAKGVQKIIRGG